MKINLEVQVARHFEADAEFLLDSSPLEALLYLLKHDMIEAVELKSATPRVGVPAMFSKEDMWGYFARTKPPVRKEEVSRAFNVLHKHLEALQLEGDEFRVDSLGFCDVDERELARLRGVGNFSLDVLVRWRNHVRECTLFRPVAY